MGDSLGADHTTVSRLSSDPALLAEVADAGNLAFLPEDPRPEIGAKYLIEDAKRVEALVDTLRSYEVQSVSSVDIVDSYWDTPDWYLFNAGWAFRWRNASGEKSLALKSIEPDNDSLHRRQLVEQQVAEFPERNGSPLLAGPVAEQLGGLVSPDLRELFRVRSNLRILNIKMPDDSSIRIAIDQATITTGLPVGKPEPGRMAFIEVELVLRDGREESLLRLATTLQQRFGLLPSRLSTFERGLQASGLSPPRAPRMASPYGDTPFLQELREQEFWADDSAVDLAYRCLLEQFEEMLVQEPKAWEGLDPEGVHQMRVGTRRLRAGFRAFKDVLPDDSIRSFNREFKWVAAALGKVRDLDVYRENLDSYAAEFPTSEAAHDSDYQRHLADKWRKARKRLLASLTSRRYERLKYRFARFLGRGPSRRAMKTFGAVKIGVSAHQLIDKRYEVVLRHGRAITPGSSSESLHGLRIQCKRLRYLFEFYYPIYGETLKPEIKKLRKLQDVLGEFQDASVATQQLRQYVESVPKQTRKRDRSIARGHLISGQNRQAAIRGADLPQAWNRFDREGGRKAVIASLREPVDSRHVDERAQDLKRMSKGRPPKPERIRQACVIPFRRLRSGTMFCLITSLNKRRWIFPKGCIDGDESVQETALKEAFEEAGLYGRVIVPPLGRYVDSKWGAILDVTVMLMEVERIDDVWQEDMRVRCWTDGKEALRLLARPELRKMLRRGIRQLSGARGPIAEGAA